MAETVTFPLGDCKTCQRTTMLAWDLDEHEELVLACLHCDTPLPAGVEPRYLGARSLQRFGYDVEGEIETRGCGAGSGGSCSGSCGSGGGCG
jgi:hypothetical protein